MKRIKKTTTALPETEQEIATLINATIMAQTAREKHVAERDQKLAKAAAMIEAESGHDLQIERCDRELAANLATLEAWSMRHPDKFGTARSLTLAGARIGWRLGNHSLVLRAKHKLKDAITFLSGMVRRGSAPEASKRVADRAALAAQYLRTTVALDKAAALRDREHQATRVLLKAAGMQFVQAESFYLEPLRDGQEHKTLTST